MGKDDGFVVRENGYIVNYYGRDERKQGKLFIKIWNIKILNGKRAQM